MSSKCLLEMKYPSQWWQGRWREMIPLGNGITGAGVYGSVWDETVMITHNDLWWRSRTPRLPDVSYVLPKIREDLLADRPFEADKIMQAELVKKEYHPEIGCPLPLADLKIKMVTGAGFKNYKRSLDMMTGEAAVSWEDGDRSYIRRCFVSYDKDIFVMEISEKSQNPFSCSFGLDSHTTEDAQRSYQREEELLPAGRRTELSEQKYLYYSAENDDGTYFGVAARVLLTGGDKREEDNRLIVRNTQKAIIILKAFVKADSRDKLLDVKKEIDDLASGYEKLFAEHVKSWNPLFTSAQLSVWKNEERRSNEELLLEAYQGEASVEMLEKMWAYGRYLLLASSRKGGNPCSLYGLWCGEYAGMWAFNMANENMQMIYWQALTGNNPELLIPVFDYVDKLMDDFRENAKKLYGCRGIFIPGPSAPDSGLVKTISPHILYWTGGAGWIGQHYYDYYLCTQDKEFLKNRAIPYLREVALFYEDFFVEGEDGFYMTIPSNSPENSPGNYWDGESGMGIVMETTMNATMDFAIAKEVLTHLMEGCRICGIETEEVDKWKMMLSKIPAYRMNEDGAVKEWMHEFYKDNYKHRHQSHLYPLFPGNEIHEEKDKELYDAFVMAAKKRLQIGINQQTGWSLAHLSNNYARMKEGELAIECIDLMCRSCVLNNFMTVHNDWRQMGIGVWMPWAPVQLDANMGLTAAINEMMMQSYENTILILPALPARLKAGSVKGLLTRQGILVGISWDMEKKIINVILENRHGEKEVRLYAPEGFACHEDLDKIRVPMSGRVELRFSAI